VAQYLSISDILSTRYKKGSRRLEMYWDKFDEWIKRAAYATEPERLLPVETNPEHPQGKA
jgi:hypothetical protein